MKNQIKILVVLALVAGVVAAQADQNNFSISGDNSSHGLSNNPLTNLDHSDNNGNQGKGGDHSGNGDNNGGGDHSGGDNSGGDHSGGDNGNSGPKIQCVPAPSSFLGLGLGIGALALLKRRNA